MADIHLSDFQKRLSRIEKEHRSLSSGYVRLQERNGVLVPVKKVRTRRGFPWRGLFLVVVVFVLFKSLMLAHLGPIGYVERHATLESGTTVEQMGAWVMRPDPATLYVSEIITPYLRMIENAGVSR